MPGATVTLRGSEALRARLRRLGDTGRDIARDELTFTAERIASKSRRLVPVDLGPLKDSIQTEYDFSGDRAHAEIGAGDAAVDYAIPQHEVTTYHHPGQGQPFYIQEPWDEERVKMLSRLRRRVDRAVGES